MKGAILVALLLVLPAIGCGGRNGELPVPTADRLDALIGLQRRGKNVEAVEGLEAFVRDHPGFSRIDEAVHSLGLAYLGHKDWELAEDSFRRLIRDFPHSPLVPEATFHLALSIYRQARPAQLDPTDTIRGREQFRVFLRLYPDHPRAAEAKEYERQLDDRIAEKIYLNAETYRKIRRYDAARLYYNRVLEEHPDSMWVARAKEGLARLPERAATTEKSS